jgi:hypothetical protein
VGFDRDHGQRGDGRDAEEGGSRAEVGFWRAAQAA